MDIETKTVIISILETLRQVADTTFEAREMAFKNYVSLRAQPGYAEAYQSQKSDLLEEIQASREKILTRLNAQLHLLEDV
ncbi:MAG: hypothetical protein ABLQ96_10990 [Candidatus Acidiferrum sp.]